MLSKWPPAVAEDLLVVRGERGGVKAASSPGCWGLGLQRGSTRHPIASETKSQAGWG